MSQPDSRAATRFATFFILSAVACLFVLAGCQKKEPAPSPPDAGTTGIDSTVVLPPPTSIEFRIGVDPLAPAIRSEVETWAQEHDLRVAFDPPYDLNHAQGEPPALIEIAGEELPALNAAGKLRPFSRASEAAAGCFGNTLGLLDSQVLGLAWRGDAVVLVSRAEDLGDMAVRSWQDLARLAGTGRLALPRDCPRCVRGLYLALLWSSGADIVVRSDSPRLGGDGGSGPAPFAEVDLDSPAAAEALSFLTGLVRPGSSLGEKELFDRFIGGDLRVLALDLGRLRRLRDRAPDIALGLWAVPPPEPDQQISSFWLRPRMLVLPRGGVYANLAEELALHLSSPETAQLLAENAPADLIPLSRGLSPEGLPAPLDQMLRLRPRGHVLALQLQWPRVRELLDGAIDLSLSRRRSPDAALAEAQRELMTSAQHRPPDRRPGAQ